MKRSEHPSFVQKELQKQQSIKNTDMNVLLTLINKLQLISEDPEFASLSWTKLVSRNSEYLDTIEYRIKISFNRLPEEEL